MKRLASLDYLRGLAAFGIMLFHYTMWTMGDYSAGDFLGRVGVYGVVIFYILSGITLYHVYYDKIGTPSKKGLSGFAVSRVARIYPLLWLMTLATLLIKQEDFPVSTILLNFTGLFGVYHWGDTVCYGAWSIGNELVFYLFFPVFIFLAKRSKMLFAAFSLALLLVFLWFTFIKMDPTKQLTAFYWIPYINPLNQVQFFLGGFLIGYFTKDRNIPGYLTLPLIAVSMLAFILYPVSGNNMLLISGGNRIVFTLICFALCLACYKTVYTLPGLLHRFFSMLGEVSYSVYLAHPLVTYVLTKVLRYYFPGLPLAVVITSCIIATIAISYIIYRWYEKPFMRLGKRMNLTISPEE